MSSTVNTSWVLVSLVVALAAYVATVRRRIADRIREIKAELDESETGITEQIVVVVEDGAGQTSTSRRTTTKLLSEDKKKKLLSDRAAHPTSIYILMVAEALLVIAGLLLAGVYGGDSWAPSKRDPWSHGASVFFSWRWCGCPFSMSWNGSGKRTLHGC